MSGGFEPAIRGESGAGHESTLAQRLVAGGYPEAVRRKPRRSRSWHLEYVRSIVERDVPDVARVKEVNDVARLLRLLALRTGELQNVSVLASELKLGRATIERYLQVLERLFLIRRLPPWQRNQAKRVIKTPKYLVVDSGIAATLSNLNQDACMA